MVDANTIVMRLKRDVYRADHGTGKINQAEYLRKIKHSPASS